MKQQPNHHATSFLTGMNIFQIVVASLFPIYTAINNYYLRLGNPRVETEFLPSLILCVFVLVFTLFDILHRQHKRIQALEQKAAASEDD